MTQELLSRPVDQDLSGCPGPDLFASLLDELVADEGRCGRPCEQAAAVWHSSPAERDGFTGTHGRVPQAAEERGQAGTDARDSRQEMPDLPRAGGSTAADFPGDRGRLACSKRRLRCVQLKDGDIGSLW